MWCKESIHCGWMKECAVFSKSAFRRRLSRQGNYPSTLHITHEFPVAHAENSFFYVFTGNVSIKNIFSKSSVKRMFIGRKNVSDLEADLDVFSYLLNTNIYREWKMQLRTADCHYKTWVSNNMHWHREDRENIFLNWIYYYNIKVEFSPSSTLVFSITWSFRNNSNMQICCSRNNKLLYIVAISSHIF